MSEREDLEQAISAVEAQRASLGDEAVDAVLGGLRLKLASLDAEADTTQPDEEAPGSDGERRIVTVLFCKVTGSHSQAEKLDTEQWASLMNEAFEILTGPVDRFGGTVARVMSDAILVFFGAPVAHEDDPQLAIRASLAIMREFQAFRDQVTQGQRLNLNVRIGINTGLVVTGRVGSKGHDEYTALGDAVNLAARMEQTAAPGTIQITEDTRRLVANEFEFFPLGDIRVRGKREPVPAFRVVGEVTGVGQNDGLSKHGISSPLVGREPEYQSMRKLVSRLLNGHGGVVSIIGEAGAGKSRLIAEARQSSPLDRLNWLEGGTLSYGQTFSYWPFQMIIWAFAGIVDEDSEATAWSKLESHVRQLFGDETIEILPFLARLVSLEIPEPTSDRVRHLDGEAIGHQIYLAARRFFERLATNRPTVLLFEDLHWADQSSALLLDHLLPLVERLPILFVVTSRPYRESPLTSFRKMAAANYGERYHEHFLAPLSEEESVELAMNLLEIERMPRGLQQMIVRKGSGNPFFLEEIIRALIGAGAVARDPASGRWQATKQAESLAIPDTVQGVIMARVDRLDERVRRLLQTASVIGRRFFHRVLEAVGDGDPSLEAQLAELENAELIRKKQLDPELEYIFTHALAQEATYQSILLRKRRELHARVGQAMERLFFARLDEFYGVLAYHFAHAEKWEKAQEYLFKAGDQAGQVAADAEALAHYQGALTAYENAFGDRWDPVQRAALARKMGEAYFRRGDHEQALQQFQQAFRLLGRPPIPEKGTPTVLAIGRALLRQLAHRLLPSLFVKAPRDDVPLEVEEEARIHNLLGWIFLFTERERFLWASVQRLNFAEQSGFLAGAASGGAAFAVVWDMIPLMKLARGYHHRAVLLAEASGELNALGIAHQALGFYELNLGQFAASTAHVRRSEEVFRQAGDLHGLGNALNLLAFNCIHQGYLNESLEIVGELISTGEDGADPQLVCWGHIARGLARERLGQLQNAEADLRRGIGLAGELPDYYWLIFGYAFLGQCLLRQDRHQEGLAALDLAQQIHVERGIGGPAMYHLRIVQAETYLSGSERESIGKAGSQLKKAETALKGAMKLAKAYRLFLPEAYRQQGTLLWLQGKQGAAEAAWQRSLEVAEALHQFYEKGVTHLEMGVRLKQRSHLDQSEMILSETGAGWHLAKLQPLLSTAGK